MFALSKIVENRLYSLADTDHDSDEMSDCMDRWTDTEYLYNFFKRNEHALEYYQVDRAEAVRLVIEQCEALFFKIRQASNSKTPTSSLDSLFQPFHKNDDFEIPIVEAKAYSGSKGVPSFLRVYAIRLQDGTYIFVGGIIKTTRALQDCKEGKEILQKIARFADFLRKQGFSNSFEIRELLI